jgi:hypothetical protein
MDTEITLTIHLDQPPTPKQLADEMALHVAQLVARGCYCGDVSLASGAEGDWLLDIRIKEEW